jgi:hypothetical protein
LDSENNLIDTEEVTIQNITIEGINYLNSYIRQAYLTAQRDATKFWTKAERDEFMKLAMQIVPTLSVGTKRGNDILFNTLDGLLHYTWVFVKHRFATVNEWNTVFRSDVRVYQEILNRFNEACVQLALLTGEEVGKELPEVNANPEGMDNLIIAVIAAGVSPEDAKKLTPEQANAIVKTKFPELDTKDPIFQTDDPEEFKAMLAKKLKGNE